MTDSTDKPDTADVDVQVDLTELLTEDTPAAPAEEAPAMFAKVHLYVEMTAFGYPRAKAFVVEADTDGNAGEAAQDLCQAIVSDAKAWIDTQRKTPRPHPTVATAGAPLSPLDHLRLAWRALTADPRAPRQIPAKPPARDITDPGVIKTATVSGTVTIGYESKSFHATVRTSGNSCDGAAAAANTVTDDMRRWAYDWSFDASVEARQKKRRGY